MLKGGYQLGPKAMKKLFNTAIPGSVKQVQELLGRLNFASRLIPGYKALVKPIERLICSQNEKQWTQRCTDNLNELFKLVA